VTQEYPVVILLTGSSGMKHSRPISFQVSIHPAEWLLETLINNYMDYTGVL